MTLKNERRRKLLSIVLSILLSILMLCTCMTTNVFAASFAINYTEANGWAFCNRWSGSFEESISEADEISNKYLDGGELYKDKETNCISANTNVSGTVVKIDGNKMYLCTDHDTTTPADGYCVTCGRNADGAVSPSSAPHTHEASAMGGAAQYTKPISSQADLKALLETGGNGYLVNDFDITSPIDINHESVVTVKLCLNGHKITNKSTTDCRFGLIEMKNCDFSIFDCSNNDSAGVYFDDSAEQSLAMFFPKGETVIKIYGGTYDAGEGHVTRFYGSQNNPTFYMYGGKLTKDYSIYLEDNGNVYLYGGEINRILCESDDIEIHVGETIKINEIFYYSMENGSRIVIDSEDHAPTTMSIGINGLKGKILDTTVDYSAKFHCNDNYIISFTGNAIYALPLTITQQPNSSNNYTVVASHDASYQWGEYSQSVEDVTSSMIDYGWKDVYDRGFLEWTISNETMPVGSKITFNCDVELIRPDDFANYGVLTGNKDEGYEYTFTNSYFGYNIMGLASVIEETPFSLANIKLVKSNVALINEDWAKSATLDVRHITSDKDYVCVATSTQNTMCKVISDVVTGSSCTPTFYTITKASTTNGSFTVSAESVTKDTEITITPTPNSGYEVDTVSVKDADNNTVTVTNNKFTMPEANVTVTVTFKASTTPVTGVEKVTDTNKATSSTPDTKITGINVSKDIELTATEQTAIAEGKDVNVFLEVSDANVVEADKTAVIAKATTESYTVGKYIDIDLFSMIEGDESSKRAITETENKITITIKLPEDLINADKTISREYSVIRLHDGEAERLAATFNPKTGEISFGTDRFSTYAIVYKDKATTPATVTPSNNQTTTTTTATNTTSPDTGDTTPLSMMIFFMIFSACGIVVFKRKRED